LDIDLSQLLEVVGKLDDSVGDDTARTRFRRFLKSNVKEIGKVRDYIEECLREKGEQYNFALQDLVNYVGEFLGFDVKYGRYRGVSNQIGYDGIWSSDSNTHIVVEVKTTDAYTIKTSTIMGYIEELISERTIPNRDSCLGLYIVGRPDSDLKQLENSLIAEKRDILRIISVDSLLSLAEMMDQYEIYHEEILGILKPSGPRIDRIIDIMARLASQKETQIQTTLQPKEFIIDELTEDGGEEQSYWLTPVRSEEEETAEARRYDLLL